MRTTVTIPDDLAKAADRQAKRLGLSRSELYARALEVFTRHHGRNDKRSGEPDPALVSQINEALVKAGADESELDDVWKAARNRALPKEDW